MENEALTGEVIPYEQPWKQNNRFRDWKPAFLAGLRQATTVRFACASAGISRPAAYLARKADPEFARAWDEALTEGIEVAEEELRRQALYGNNIVALIFYLKAHAPAKYRETVRVDINMIRAEAQALIDKMGLNDDIDIDEVLQEAERMARGG